MVSSSKSAQRTLAFVFVTVLIDSIGFGIIIPVLPELIMEITGEGVGAAAAHGGYLMFAFAAMQFVCSPLMGNLSDRFGRRPVLLISLGTLGIDYVIMGVAPSLLWLFIGRLVAGMSASTFSTANACIADVSEPDKRAQRFGMLGAAFGLGFVFGPALGGFLGELGPRVPFFATAGLALLNMVYGLLVLPETLPKERRRAFDLGRANPVGAALQMRRYPMVAGLLLAAFLYQMGHFVLPSIWSYYAIEKFTWTEREIGLSLAAVGVMVALVQGGLVRPAIKRLGMQRALIVGLVFAALSLVAYGLVSEGWMVFVVMVPGALAGFTNPALQGIMSGRIPAEAQGELQGTVAAVGSLTAILSPPLMTQTFAAFSTPDESYFPGAPFLLAGALTLAALAVAMLVLGQTRRRAYDHCPTPNTPAGESAPAPGLRL